MLLPTNEPPARGESVFGDVATESETYDGIVTNKVEAGAFKGKLNASHRLVISAGQYGSGSTWAFNSIVKILSLTHPTSRIFKLYSDQFGDEEIPNQHIDRVVVKTHKLPSSVRLLARLSSTPILLTVRDPRDAVASLMSRFDIEFEAALEHVRQSGEALAPLADSSAVLTLRYEDRFTSRRKTIDFIAGHLGVSLNPHDRDVIWAALTPQAVNAVIDDLAAKGVLTEDVWTYDPDTQWHPRHVGDGRAGKWRSALTPKQAGRVESGTPAFRTAFGYPDAAN